MTILGRIGNFINGLKSVNRLFYCSYFIKQLLNGFPCRIAWSMHLGCCSTFGKRKNTLACGSCILRFPKISQHPACMDHAILHGKLFSNPLVLHCIALHCIALHCIALHCIALHCIALHCIALHCIALHCIALHCIALHCIALHCIALHCIALHCIALHCIALHCITLHCIVLCNKCWKLILVNNSRKVVKCSGCGLSPLKSNCKPEIQATALLPVMAARSQFCWRKIFSRNSSKYTKRKLVSYNVFCSKGWPIIACVAGGIRGHKGGSLK